MREFQARYHQHSAPAALSAATEALFTLNRLAKDRYCESREAIYALKNRTLKLLWDGGYCFAASLATSPAKPCWTCDGAGFMDDGWDFGREYSCDRCGGTGDWVAARSYWAFRFRIGETNYSWHQPAETAPWACALGEPQPHEVLATVKEAHLTPCEVRSAMALLHWVLGDLAAVDSAGPSRDSQ